MQVTFYKNFKKRINSTKRPTGTGTVLNCKLKRPTSMDNPILVLKGWSNQFNYALFEGKYYYINDVTIISYELAEISLVEDVLATYKDEIGNTTAFVEYSSSAYSVNLPDTRISTGNIVNHPSVFQNVFDDGDGSIVIRVVSDDLDALVGLSGAYAINSAGAGGIVDALYDNTIIQDLSTILMSPYDAIISAHWVPFAIQGNSGYVYLGKEQTGVGGVAMGPSMNIAPTTYSLDIPWFYEDFRDFAPYSFYELYLPFYGTVELDPLKMQGNVQIQVDVTKDGLSGEVCYMVHCGTYVEQFIAQTAVPLPVSQVTGQRPQGLAGALAGAGAVLASGLAMATGGASIPLTMGLIGGVGALGSGVVNSFGKTQSSKGGGGGFGSANQVIKSSLDSWQRSIILTQYSQQLSTEPSNLTDIVGRPLKSTRLIGNLSGYVQCSGASISIDGFEFEKEKVNAYVNGGFYYE